MASIDIRINEGCQPQPQLTWDTAWQPLLGYGDWIVGQKTEPQNVAGLRALRPIETAVMLCLFTDARCPVGHPLEKNITDGDRRGYWGDDVDVRTDLGEGPLGSLLWLIERSAIDPQETPMWTQTLAAQALQTLLDQGICAKVQTKAFYHPPSRIDLAVTLFGPSPNNETIFSGQWTDIWKRELLPVPDASPFIG